MHPTISHNTTWQIPRLGACAAFMLVMILLNVFCVKATAAEPDVQACNETISTRFKPDAQTKVMQVAYFRKGETLTLDKSLHADPLIAPANVCMVKIIVGPGNPGPADAPSTSAGIGIEIWLPDKANWNGRLHALGGGGWQGGAAGIAGSLASSEAALIAGSEGAVSSTTDTGHTDSTGSFAMLPDGSINRRLWQDFASRAIHEQAVKSKALAEFYYGTRPHHAYWEGGSTGGRQGMSLAQNHPEDFDGIVAMYPAVNWTRFITGELYPQIVIQRELAGKRLSKAQLDLASNAAIASCDEVGGEHLGYIIDPSGCRYDPVSDIHVLCVIEGGANPTPDCLRRSQAEALNRIWYGMTSDGLAPSPSQSNGWQNVGNIMRDDEHRWYGPSRGTALYLDYPGFEGLVNPDHPFSIATHLVALEMQEPAIAEPKFRNATGNGQSGWQRLTYRQLARAFDLGVALQDRFENINSDNPDLTAFERRGGKLLTWHGMADEVIPAQGTVDYYERVARRMGGMDRLRKFYRLYLVPGAGHGTPNGTSNRMAVIPVFGPQQMYDMLTGWVEKQAVPPSAVILQSKPSAEMRSMPTCAYPQVISYQAGNPKLASSYRCLADKRGMDAPY